MFRFTGRRRTAARAADVTYCERCGQACTAACRSTARLDRARTEALRRTLTR